MKAVEFQVRHTSEGWLLETNRKKACFVEKMKEFLKLQRAGKMDEKAIHVKFKKRRLEDQTEACRIQCNESP